MKRSIEFSNEAVIRRASRYHVGPMGAAGLICVLTHVCEIRMRHSMFLPVDVHVHSGLSHALYSLLRGWRAEDGRYADALDEEEGGGGGLCLSFRVANVRKSQLCEPEFHLLCIKRDPRRHGEVCTGFDCVLAWCVCVCVCVCRAPHWPTHPYLPDRDGDRL